MQSGVFAIACKSKLLNDRSAYILSNILPLTLPLLYNPEDPIIIAVLLLNVQVFGVPNVFHPKVSRMFMKWSVKSPGSGLARSSKPVAYILPFAIRDSISGEWAPWL